MKVKHSRKDLKISYSTEKRALREETINHYEQSYIQVKKYIDEDIEMADIDKSIFN